MKITIDCPNWTDVIFVNYVYSTRCGQQFMGCKSIQTDELVDGTEFKLLEHEEEED